MATNKLKQSDVFKLVLFDIDNTLISNGGASRRALYQALQKCLSIDIAKLEMANLSLSGKTDPQIIRELIAVGLNTDNLVTNSPEDYWQLKIQEILEFYLEVLPVELGKPADTKRYFMHEGVVQLLALLGEEENIALGLLTGNVEKGARIKLEPFQLNKYFPIGAYGSDSASRLDLPAIAHKRAEAHYQNSWTPRQIIIIGDAENDILCAQHYGAVSLAINTGRTTWDELNRLRPDHLFPSLNNASQILAAIMSEAKVDSVFNQA